MTTAEAVPRVSVVIPTFQRRASVLRAVDALRAQALPADQFEVIVSIDGSDDGTRESLELLRTPFALRGVWNPNAGRAAACNAGIRAARGWLVVLLDDDMEPEPGFLDGHVRAHEGGRERGVLGAVPVAVAPDSPPVVEFIAAGFARHLEKLERPGQRIGIRDFYSGNFSIEREVLGRVGLFDPNFKEYGNEDGELAIRLLEAGVQLTYSSTACARQHYQKDFPSLAHDKMAQGRTSVVCALRHPEAVPSLRIGTYREGPRRWRLMRGALLTTSRRVRSLPRWVLRYVAWLEHHRSPRLQALYRMALDYFYWLGVQSALRDHPGARARIAV